MRSVFQLLILIHSPHTGRDCNPTLDDKYLLILIHSPHTGRDAGAGKITFVASDFNPLSPHGERRQDAPVMLTMDAF